MIRIYTFHKNDPLEPAKQMLEQSRASTQAALQLSGEPSKFVYTEVTAKRPKDFLEKLREVIFTCPPGDFTRSLRYMLTDFASIHPRRDELVPVFVPSSGAPLPE